MVYPGVYTRVVWLGTLPGVYPGSMARYPSWYTSWCICRVYPPSWYICLPTPPWVYQPLCPLWYPTPVMLAGIQAYRA